MFESVLDGLPLQLGVAVGDAERVREGVGVAVRVGVCDADGVQEPVVVPVPVRDVVWVEVLV